MDLKGDELALFAGNEKWPITFRQQVQFKEKLNCNALELLVNLYFLLLHKEWVCNFMDLLRSRIIAS